MRAEGAELRYADVNRDIVRSLVETGPKYYITLACAIGLTLVCFFFPWFYQLQVRHRRGRNESSAGLGNLRGRFHFLDRPESLRHAAVLRSAHHSQLLAQGDVSQRGGHDAVLADGGRHHGDGAPRASLVHPLGLPVSQSDGAVAEFSLAAVVRRHGHRDLSHRQLGVHLHGIDPRFRRSQGPHDRLAPSHVHVAFARLARHGHRMASPGVGLHAARGSDHSAGGLGAQHRLVGLGLVHRAGAAPDHLRAVLRGRRHLLRHRRHRHGDVPAAEIHGLRALHHRSCTSTTWASCCWRCR